jgi:hypothetical protein
MIISRVYQEGYYYSDGAGSIEAAGGALRDIRLDEGCVKERHEVSGKLSSQMLKYPSRSLRRSTVGTQEGSIARPVHIF